MQTGWSGFYPRNFHIKVEEEDRFTGLFSNFHIGIMAGACIYIRAHTQIIMMVFKGRWLNIEKKIILCQILVGASGGGLLQCFLGDEVGDCPYCINVEVEKSTCSPSETRSGKSVGNGIIIWKHQTKAVRMNWWNKSLLVRTGVCQTLMPGG